MLHQILNKSWLSNPETLDFSKPKWINCKTQYKTLIASYNRTINRSSLWTTQIVKVIVATFLTLNLLIQDLMNAVIRQRILYKITNV